MYGAGRGDGVVGGWGGSQYRRRRSWIQVPQTDALSLVVPYRYNVNVPSKVSKLLPAGPAVLVNVVVVVAAIVQTRKAIMALSIQKQLPRQRNWLLRVMVPFFCVHVASTTESKHQNVEICPTLS